MAMPSGNKIPTLVIDSSAIRNHLFKGWAVLNRVAIIARAGKINLCIPWIIEQEVLHGIEEHVDELTEQKTFLKNVRLIAQMSSEVSTIHALCDKFETLRPQICDEAKSRFQHWLETSQAERLPLKHEQTVKVFQAYFGGNLPFDRPKNREHLPDSFIYEAVLDLISGDREVWFLAGDVRLIESLQKNKAVRVYENYYPLFGDLQVPFNYEQQNALLVGSLDTQALCESARLSLQSELCGQTLRYGSSEQWASKRIREVLQIQNLSVDQESIMHIDDGNLLIAFEADVQARVAERTIANREVTERLSEFGITIRGHFLVNIDKADKASPKIVSVEMDDFEVGAMQEKAGNQILQSIPPQPKVVYYHENNFKNVVENNDGGLVVVVGSTARNRRLVVEHLIAARRKAWRSGTPLIGFTPLLNELDIPFHDCDSEGNQKSVLEILGKVENAELDALGLSCEADWATVKAIDSLRDSNCFIVVTMKSINNRSAVVRHLVKITGGTTDLQYLTAVAWIQEVTPETITFAISQSGGWGDGSWEGVLRRDESLKGMPVSNE